ncbi:DUF4230 domain-containing protein [Candidatus Parcubacteria bacterium]|nr:DUF4230 domain-containing protein [Candidatus Parcubacteria bacterium]
MKKTKKFLIILIVFVVTYLIISTILFFKDEGIVFNLDQTSVVKEIRSLNRIETASFNIEKIIEASTESNAFKDLLFGDKILLIAHAEVIAGFDFAQLDQDDVRIRGKKLRITLPEPEILTTRLDNEKTRVYDRQMGILTKGDSQLESEARLAAEDSIKEAACQSDILEIASINAEKQLKLLFRSVGFEEVTIIIPEGDC